MYQNRPSPGGRGLDDLRGFIAALLLLVCLPALCKPTEAMCEAVAVARESSGESLEGARAVLSVVRNRMRIDNMTACQVVTAKNQWSWYKPHMKWDVSKEQLTRYHKLCTMSSILPSDIYFFHSGKRRKKWLGKYYTTIGRHKFYKASAKWDTEV